MKINLGNIKGLFSRDTLKKVQREQKPWVEHNFGNRPSW